LSPRAHRIVINVTPEDLLAGPVTVTVIDASSNGPLDEAQDYTGVDNAGTVTGGTGGAGGGERVNEPLTCVTLAQGCDPTRFTLLGPQNQIISQQISTLGAGGTVSGAPGTNIAFPAITTPGVYTIVSETGGIVVGDTSIALNNDDNAFQLQVSGGSNNLLLGQFQGSLQNQVQEIPQLDFFFFVPPGTGTLQLRNFDLDGGAGNADPNVTVGYLDAAAAPRAGTASGPTVWNGGGNLNTGADNFTLNAADPGAFGLWTLRLNNYGGAAGTNTSINQAILEVNADNQRLVLFDRRPTRAGNFTITPPTTFVRQVGQPADHDFTVTNLFFTSDIVTLTFPPEINDPNYTVELFQIGAGGALTAITIPPGTRQINTPAIPANGGTVNYRLRVTPRVATAPANQIVISGTSFLDNQVRPGQAQPQTVTKITSTQPIAPPPPTSGPATDLHLRNSVNNPSARPGDEVIYTVTVWNEGRLNATGVSVLSQVPPGITFIGATPSQGTYDPATGLWTIGGITAGAPGQPGQTVTLQIRGRVTTTERISSTARIQTTTERDIDSTPGDLVPLADEQVENRGGDDQETAVISSANLRLVKRITGIVRTNGTVSRFNTVVNDPNDPNDEGPWPAGYLAGVTTTVGLAGQPPLNAGDRVEYTIYYLSDGSANAFEVNLCDEIPASMTFVPNSNQAQRLNGPFTGSGLFLTPLTPLPGFCRSDGSNQNGAVTYGIGPVVSTPGQNFGAVRFQTQVD
jgi:uncharacterized repeat protein (TIGR01451 family)